ncbi:sialic acid-binding Ig-like lectin 13 [Echinops telfairi]|uniref:Sialic acid-binding Ig-like lectin 13 n=1 Tax=Echinops telfairi TaxID=9371 RepID=A0ABM0ZSE3_ECHTE|nr:sialic acid-binding Ig-like lectin 13 [Echinops telfairi]
MLWLLLPLLWTGSLAQDDQYQLEMQRSVTVQEGLCTFLPCTITYPHGMWTDSDPTYGSWFRDGADVNQDAPVATNHPGQKVQEETQGRFYLLGDPRNHTCSLDIRDTRMADNGSYFFQVARGSMKWNYTLYPLSVHVKPLTQKPNIQILRSLVSGRLGTVTCPIPWACDRGRAPIFSWMGPSIVPGDSMIPNSSVLTFTPRPQDHGTNLTCQVTFPGAGVTTNRTILLKVSYSPQNVTIAVFQGNDTESNTVRNGSSVNVQVGQYLRLVCVVDSNPPSTVTWARGSLTLKPSMPSEPEVMELLQVKAEDGGEFTCRAQYSLDSLHVSLKLSVQSSSSCCPCAPGRPKESRALILTLTRGCLMGAGFVFTYGLFWIYYTW